MKKPFSNIKDHINDQFWIIYLSVCDAMGIDPDIGRMKTRKREIVLTRQISMYMMFQYTSAGPSDIGAFFSQDHATASHAKASIENLLDTKNSLVCECYNWSVNKYKNSPPYVINQRFDFIMHAATTFR